MDDREVSRSDGESSWRRGGGGGRGFDSRGGPSASGGGYNDRGGGGGGGYNSSRDGESSWRRGGGGGSSSGFDSRGREGGIGASEGESSWRRGGSAGSSAMGRMGSHGSAASGGGDRPRLNLSRRTKEDDSNCRSNAATSSNQPKANPFGSATAVDTASKFAKLDLREKEQKEQKKIQEENEQAKDQEKRGEQDEVANEEETKPIKEATMDAPEKTVAENNIVEANNETNIEVVEPAKEGDSNDEKTDGEKEKRRERRERKLRQPKVVNSRAAMLDAAEAPKKEVSSLLLLLIYVSTFFACENLKTLEFSQI